VNGLLVQGLRVAFGARAVVDGVDVSVGPGEWTSVVGPNGAGKTTLLHAIAGMTRPAAGTITLDGHELTTLGARARARLVALVPQTPVVPAGVSVLDYALLGRTPHIPYFGVESGHDLRTTEEMLDQLGVADLAARPLSTLSGGERQRVVLARALLQEAPILLLDEPTTALDIGHQQEVLELVEHLRRARGLAVLSTMHDLTLAGLYADELLLFDNGRVAARGSAETVLTEAHLFRHFGARVTVFRGVDGPVVVPSRIANEAKA